MANILHRVEIKQNPLNVYNALSEEEGLARWWTPMVEASPKVGSVASFRFGDGSHGPDMKVTDLVPGERVAWTCVEGPWKGHDFEFKIQEKDGRSVLLFAHRGWEDASEFYMHCNCKWGFFLGVSLKSYLESGTGMPHPQDPDL